MHFSSYIQHRKRKKWRKVSEEEEKADETKRTEYVPA